MLEDLARPHLGQQGVSSARAQEHWGLPRPTDECCEHCVLPRPCSNKRARSGDSILMWASQLEPQDHLGAPLKYWPSELPMASDCIPTGLARHQALYGNFQMT